MVDWFTRQNVYILRNVCLNYILVVQIHAHSFAKVLLSCM